MVTSSTADVGTDRPERYGKQLVTHLSRRHGGEWSAESGSGHVVLGDGAAEVVAQGSGLRLVVRGPANRIGSLEDVVGRHLVRFATRDRLVCQWVREGGRLGSRQESEVADTTSTTPGGAGDATPARAPSGPAGPRSATATHPVWGAPAVTRPALPGDRDADVVVVGAGFTGLWTAYYLLEADPSLRVVVLEKEAVGFGASGRNGGWCSAIFPVSLDRVARGSSREAAVRLQHAMNETVEEVGRVMAAEGVDCDFAQHGIVSLARTPAQLARVAAARDAAARFGLPDQWRVLDRAEAREHVDARGVLGAAATPHCAVVHPGKLVTGLAELVERRGGVIHERTPVTSIDEGGVATPHGRVRAPHVVRATEGYTPTLPGQRRAVVPLYSLVLATEPIAPSRLSALGLDRRVAFNDLRNLRIYAQVGADGRIVFGGRGAPYHLGSTVRDAYDLDDRIHSHIHDTLRDFFPSLTDVAITHRWGGPLGVPRDWHPSVGLDRATGHAWAGSYVGDGVATSNLAGRILRNLILERDEDIDDLPIVDHRSPQWEPEPLRWLGVNAGLLAASLADTEERLTRRPSRVAAALEKLTGAH